MKQIINHILEYLLHVLCILILLAVTACAVQAFNNLSEKDQRNILIILFMSNQQ